MYCKNCNKEIKETSKFCQFCGTAVAADTAKPFPETEAVSYSDNNTEEKPFPETEAVSQPEAPAPTAEPAAEVKEEEKQKEEFFLQGTGPVSEDIPAPSAPMAAVASEIKEAVPEENSGSPVASTPQPQAEAADTQAPAQFDQFAPEQPVEKTKKKNKALPIIIAASAAALVGIFCLCFFCFRADIMHAFMGDAEYAKSIMNGVADTVKEQEVSASSVNSAYSAISNMEGETPDGCEEYVEEMTEKYGDSDTDFNDVYLTGAVLRIMGQTVNEQLPESGVSANSSFKIQLSDEIMDMLTEESELSESDLTEIIDYINLTSFDAAFKADENSVQFSTGANGAEGDFADMSFYYGKDGEAYITLGGLSEKAISLPLPAFETIDEDLSDSEDDDEAAEKAEELKSYFTEMYEAFINSYDDAKITYEKGEETVGEIEFKGKVVTVKLDNEVLSDLFEEFYDITDDSDAASELFGEDFAESFKSASESVKESDDSELIIESYVNNANTLLGMKLTVVDEDSEASIIVLASSKGIAAKLESEDEDSEDETSFEFECLFSGKNEGVMTFKLPLSKYDYETSKSTMTDNVITINYSDMKEVEVFGQKYTTGHYEANIDFEYFDDTDKLTIGNEEVTLGELLRDSALTIDLTEKDGGISYTLGFKNDLIGDYSATVTSVPTKEDVVPVDYSSMTVIDALADTDNEEGSDLSLEILDSLVSKIESDKKLNDALTIGENSLLDSLKEARDEVKAEKEFMDKDFSGDWTTTKINGLTPEIFAEDYGLYSWEVASNLTFTADTVTITNLNGSTTYTYKKNNGFIIELTSTDSYMLWLMYDAATNSFSYNEYNETVQTYLEYTVEMGTQDVTMPEGFVDTRDKGKVLNIMCWNTELQGYMADYYPGYEYISDYTGRIGDVTVNWIIEYSDGDNYQSELDNALINQQYAYYDDDKIDLFLVEPDYAQKYIESDYVLPVSEIGLTDEDTADMYNYTIQLGSNEDGQLKGVSYMTCPGVFAYRRSIAKEVLGTDNPEQVQAMLSDWNNFINIAKKMKDNNYYMVSSYEQLLKPCLQEYSMPLVSEDGTLALSDGMANWISVCEQLAEYGCCKDLENIWYYDSTTGGDVFGVFFPTWGVNYTLEWMNPDSYGDWAICEGPSAYYWGGTMLCVANGTDNPNLIADIMRKLTSVEETGVAMATDPDVLTFPNDKSAGQKAAESNFTHENFAGQNSNEVFRSVAEKIDASYRTFYDYDLILEIEAAFVKYFRGKTDFSTALLEYYNSAVELYPELH